MDKTELWRCYLRTVNGEHRTNNISEGSYDLLFGLHSVFGAWQITCHMVLDKDNEDSSGEYGACPEPCYKSYNSFQEKPSFVSQLNTGKRPTTTPHPRRSNLNPISRYESCNLIVYWASSNSR